jgi:biopolymer transport protein ExbD
MGASAALRTRVDFAPAKEPNVIPFIDVLLVLLIIFMVTAPKPTTDIRLDLAASANGPPPVIEPTIVEVRDTLLGARVFVAGEETALGEVSERTLAHVLASDSMLTAEDAFAEARIFVRSDLDVPYQNIVSVVDELQEARFQKVAVMAQSVDE